MSVRSSESGISILELAIMLPLVLLLISGIIDMGFAVNRVKTVVSASRQAARIAASHSKFLSAPVACGTAISSNCAQLAPFSENPSVTEVAAHAACTYVGNNAGARENWLVEVPAPTVIAEDGALFSTTRVSLEFTGKKCFICAHHVFATFEPRSTSSFLLEGVCL